MKLLLELSMRASVMACAVLAARICFKRLPKGMFYVLWILVFMRAALVFSFPAKISIWNADFSGTAENPLPCRRVRFRNRQFD